MTTAPARPAGRRVPGRAGPRAVPGLLLLGVLLPAAAGCTSGSAAAEPRAPHAGSYAVASPEPAVLATPSAGEGHYALVAAGDPVVTDVGAARVVALVSGPDVTVPPGPPVASAPGVLTVSLTSQQGELDVPASSFLLLGEGRQALAATPDAASVHVGPGRPAVLHLSATLPSGHTTLTWQPTGHPLVTWDFVVEMD